MKTPEQLAGSEEYLVFGDFFRNRVGEASSDLVWVARKL
jgi:hypothetical protein